MTAQQEWAGVAADGTTGDNSVSSENGRTVERIQMAHETLSARSGSAGTDDPRVSVPHKRDFSVERASLDRRLRRVSVSSKGHQGTRVSGSSAASSCGGVPRALSGGWN